MRRINLVGTVERGRPAAVSPWVAGASAGSLALLLASLLVAHATSRAELAAQGGANAEQQAAIGAITSRAADHPAVRAELGALRERASVVARVQRSRVDASTRLLEMSRVLSRGGGPTLAPTGDRGAGGAARFSTTWDPHRLWLTAMEEEGDRLTIRGEGLSVGDVGELLSRLQASVYFRDVRLERTEQVTAGDHAQRVQRFTLGARL